MRDFGKVSPQFWIGATGKSLRGDPEAQVLALYLMTGPHATATGVYHCPMLYISHETGLTQKGASKALQRLIDGGFCRYDEASETVFVVQMAKHQIEETLEPKDKRVRWVTRQVEMMPKPLKNQFLAIYGKVYHQPEIPEPLDSPLEGASIPLRSKETEKETETERDGAPPGRTPKVNGNHKPRKVSLPENFILTSELSAYATAKLPGVDPIALFESFRAKALAKGWQYVDWSMAFQEFVRNAMPTSGHFSAGNFPKASAGERQWQ